MQAVLEDVARQRFSFVTFQNGKDVCKIVELVRRLHGDTPPDVETVVRSARGRRVDVLV